MVEVGFAVPDVTVKDDAGNDVRLTEIPRPFVLYFYPKADTPGCTSEGGQFRDLYEQFKGKGTEIIGVSRDTVDAQHAFKVKYSFPFRLLADVDSKICDGFGTIVERERDGVKSKGVARATFLVGKSGKVEKVWPAVSVEGHGADVLACVL
ncbi:MAG TPA: peroxiredoxin [Candidatus Lustribacter sp.]|jgi:peroxiredoxin Q/BCP|nr:peroxiredoxin [Candidatus Lustribacter sp.]